MSFQPRFDKGIYRDCKWCKGAGCISCPAEADKEYKRQFPDGPKPILTISKDELDAIDVSESTGGPGVRETHGEIGVLAATLFDALQQKGGAK